VTVPTDFGSGHLSPLIGGFLKAYPQVSVSMVLENRHVELISEGFDVAIRMGEMEDSTLKARRICDTTMRMIGSPAYFAANGHPERIEDLNEHRLLHFSNEAQGNVWKLLAPSGERRFVRSTGALTVNDGQALLKAAIGGFGIAFLPSFLFGEALRAGEVEEAMPHLPMEIQSLHAVYPPGRYTQPKLRAFIDFLVDQFKDKGPMDW